jgi:hypothetical protein
MAHRINRRDLTLDLIRVSAGIGCVVYVHASDAKRWELTPGARAEKHVTTDWENSPEGTLFLHKCDSGISGWRIRSKSGKSAESDEYYAPSADVLDRALSAVTWALNYKERHQA